MKLSDRTVTILKNFSLINQSLCFKKGSVLSTISTGKSILGIAKIAEKFPQDFAIYDLSRFLGVHSLFETPDIQFEKGWLTIAAENHSVKYIYASPDMIDKPKEGAISVDKFEIEFSLPERNLSALMKAAALMQLPEVAVVGDGKKMFIASLNTENPTGDEYVVEVGKSISNKFRMVFDVENLKLLSDEYKVQISSKGIGCFTSKDLTYWVPCKQKASEFKE
jgi:hypothetical protein